MRLINLPSSAALVLLLGWGGLATADVTSHERLVHETTTSVSIDLTPETVICSAADYSFPALKILIPELAALTLLDHQNFGAGAPCVAAGQCGLPDGVEPGDILDSGDLVDEVDIVVKAIRVDYVDDENLTCVTALTERVDVEVRGVSFFHERYADLGSRPYADCAPPAEEEDPPNDYEGGDGNYGEGNYAGDRSDSKSYRDKSADNADESGSAGCSTSKSGSGSSSLLFLLGLVVLGRRLRRGRRA